MSIQQYATLHDILPELFSGDRDLLTGLCDGYNAAPADPAEAVRVLVQTIASLRDPYDAINETTRAVLVSLGYPDGSPRQETPT